jgi:flagellar protein FlaJ
MSAGVPLLREIDRLMPASIDAFARSRWHRSLRRVYRSVPRGLPAAVYIGRIYVLSIAAAVLPPVGVLVATPLGWIPMAWETVLVTLGLSTGFAGTVLLVGLMRPRVEADIHRREVVRTLPGAVGHLRVLASGGEDPRGLFERAAAVEAHGGTAAEFRRVLTVATLSGRLEEGITTVARVTAAQESLSPFLVNLRAHLAQGPEALRGFLALETRLLRHQQAALRRQTMGMLELIAELVMVLLVLPALVVVILTMLGPILPVTARAVMTPLGPRPMGMLIMWLAAGFVLTVGAVAGGMVATLRPQEHVTQIDRPSGAMQTLAAAGVNPAAMSVVAGGPGVLVATGALILDGRAGLCLLLGFTAWAVPVGVVGWRRAREDDAKDDHLRDLVHAVAGYLDLGVPFADALDRITRESDLGPLRPDAARLAVDLRLRDGHPDHRGSTQEVALRRFSERVGTPLAARTMGVIATALAAGAEPHRIFERLQAEVGELYREKQALRAEMQVYAAVGWTTALLVLGIAVTATTQLFEELATLTSVGGRTLEGAGYRVLLTTAATAIAAGWFAGMASRDRYAGLLHAGVLAAITLVAGAVVGML